MHLTIQFSLWHSNISHTFCEYGKFAPATTVQVRCPTACWCGQTSALLSSVSQLWPAQAAGLPQGFQTSHSHIPQHWGLTWNSRRWTASLFPSPALGVPELEHSLLQDHFACFFLSIPSKPLKTFTVTYNDKYLLPQWFFKFLFLHPPVKVLPLTRASLTSTTFYGQESMLLHCPYSVWKKKSN